MKIRNLLTLLALFLSPFIGTHVTQLEKSTQATVSAPASVEARDLVGQLKARVDPTYIARLSEHTDHSQKPNG